MRGAAAPQQQPGFRRLASFQGVSAFRTHSGVGREGGRGADVSARYVRSAGVLMKEARRGGGVGERVGPLFAA